VGDESQHHPYSTATSASAHTGLSRRTLLKIVGGASGVWLASACAAPSSSSPATAPTVGPSGASTVGPSGAPTGAPTPVPAGAPTLAPAGAPAPAPAGAPTVAPAVTTSLTKIVISYSELDATDLAMFLAKDLGYFEQQGVDADLQFIASSTGIPALLSSQTQFALLGAPETVGAAVAGGDTVAFIQLSGAQPYLMEVQKDIQTMDGLKGKKVGISSFGSSSDAATRQSLKLQGLDADTDVSLVVVGSAPNRYAAMLSGGIDAGLASPPDTLLLEDGGLHALYDCSTLSMLPLAQSLITRKATIAQNRDLVQRVANAIVAGTVFQKKDREASEQTLGKWTQSNPSYTNQHALDVAWDYWTGRILRSPPTLKLSEWQGFVDQLASSNPKAQGFDASTIIDTGFVEAAVAQGYA
jgi:NitT/TauT family transport system substrate-binding protein